MSTLTTARIHTLFTALDADRNGTLSDAETTNVPEVRGATADNFEGIVRRVVPAQTRLASRIDSEIAPTLDHVESLDSGGSRFAQGLLGATMVLFQVAAFPFLLIAALLFGIFLGPEGFTQVLFAPATLAKDAFNNAGASRESLMERAASLARNVLDEATPS